MTVAGIYSTFLTPTPAEFQRVTKIAGESAVLSQFLQHIKPGDVIWDVGGNIGTHAITFAKSTGASGQVITFEPEQYVFHQLKKNIELNELSNVSPMNFALGERTAKGWLHIDRRTGSGLHSMLRNVSPNVQEISVNVGDDVVVQRIAPAPNAIKIDVEGYELHVIKGMKQVLGASDCRALMCEVHTRVLKNAGEIEEELYAELRRAGFTRFARLPRGLEYHLIATKH